MSVSNDPSFGPLLSAGIGGDAAALLGGRVHHSLPLTAAEAAALARSLPGVSLIAGSLHQPAADRSALQDVLLRLGQLAVDVPELAELVLDPLIASPAGVVVGHANGRVAPRPSPEPWVRRLL